MEVGAAAGAAVRRFRSLKTRRIPGLPLLRQVRCKPPGALFDLAQQRPADETGAGEKDMRLGAGGVKEGGMDRTQGGRFVGVVLPRICPLEIALFLARGEPRTAFRRFRRAPVGDVEGRTFPMRGGFTGAATP